jgi:hypothetical protein
MPESQKSIPTLLTELRELLVAYLKQEALEPIKELGRFVAFGVAGSMLLSVGLVLLVLSGLRALQTETGTTFTGNWSWAPYMITLAACGLVAVLAGRAIPANRRKERA